MMHRDEYCSSLVQFLREMIY